MSNEVRNISADFHRVLSRIILIVAKPLSLATDRVTSNEGNVAYKNIK